jgi:hypothetical protein
LSLHRCQFGDGITPALDAAASVGWGADAGGGLTGGLSSSVTGLTFGIGHRPVADRLARHAPLRSVTSRYPVDALAQLLFLKRQLVLPVSMMSQ